MPRFVVLTHDWPSLHWDFMLEVYAGLRTWRLAAPPDRNSDIAAHPLANHRIAYLDYEGPVGGNRGRVARWDTGEFRWLDDSPEHLEVALAGRILRGKATLKKSATSTEWTFHFVADASRESD